MLQENRCSHITQRTKTAPREKNEPPGKEKHPKESIAKIVKREKIKLRNKCEGREI
jgi:hypothetical protein